MKSHALHDDLYLGFHQNIIYARQVFKWRSTDSEEDWLKHRNNPEYRQMLDHLGYTSIDDIVYSYNEHGFRDEEFRHCKSGIALGCSHTEGIGLPKNRMWVTKLEQLQNIKIWNLGVGGSSLDTCYRLLRRYIDKFETQFVVCAIPSFQRVEVARPIDSLPHTISHNYFSNDSTLEKFYKVWSISDLHMQLHQEKTLAACELLCTKKNIPFFAIEYREWCNDITLNINGNHHARDLQHAGESANDLAARIFHHRLNQV